jgi:hypothetical protein
LPRLARADGAEGTQLFPTGDHPRAGTELETASFFLGGQRGSYASIIPRGEWRPVESLSLRLRMPIYSMSLANEPSSRDGFGDAEVRTRVQLVSGEPVRVSAGWVMQLPTGAKHAGLGEGAFQFVPFVNVGVRPLDWLIAYVILADSLSLAGTHQPRFANYVDPGADHELRTTGGALVPITDKVSAQGYLQATTILTKADRGRSLMTSGFQLGTQPDPKLRLVLACDLPVLGEERFTWKLNASAMYAF